MKSANAEPRGAPTARDPDATREGGAGRGLRLEVVGLRLARRREKKEGRRILFPVRLAPFEEFKDWELFDADAVKDTAAEIREYFIPDFTNWKDHDSFEVAYKRLMKDFKPSPEDG